MHYALVLLALLSTAAVAAEDPGYAALRVCHQEETALKNAVLEAIKAAQEKRAPAGPAFSAFNGYDYWMKNDGFGKCVKRRQQD